MKRKLLKCFYSLNFFFALTIKIRMKMSNQKRFFCVFFVCDKFLKFFIKPRVRISTYQDVSNDKKSNSKWYFSFYKKNWQIFSFILHLFSLTSMRHSHYGQSKKALVDHIFKKYFFFSSFICLSFSLSLSWSDKVVISLTNGFPTDQSD